jgi:hypothetical protein
LREYTHVETIIANIPYAAMILMGTITIAYAYSFSPPALTAAGGYFVYGIAGALWIILFVCPYCTYYGSESCPCGYGTLSSRLVKRGNESCFAEKFRRHIPVIVPLWLIPVVCAVLVLLSSFSWWLVGLVLAFVLESWVILPLVSRKHGCVDCPQKTQCPWMARGSSK